MSDPESPPPPRQDDGADLDPYLWDGSGAVDPFVADLERALAPLQGAPREPPPSTSTSTPRALSLAWVPAVAAALALALFWLLPTSPTSSPSTSTKAGPAIAFRGRATVAGVARDGGTLAPGAALVAVDDVTLALGPHGQARVARGSVVAVDENGAAAQTLTLTRGALSASVDAPPRFFTVHTPAVTAVDLGCAYDLVVDDDGTRLRVTSGIVSLEGSGGRATTTLVPRGAEARVRAGAEPELPFSITASPAFRAAAAAGEVDVVVAAARVEDAVTLWHLVSRSSGAARAAYADALVAALGVDDDAIDVHAVRAGDEAVLDTIFDRVRATLIAPWER